MIESRTANVLCFLIGSVYVLGLYAIPARIRSLARDNVEHIRYRLGITAFTNVLTLLILSFYYEQLTRGSLIKDSTFLNSIGIRLDNCFASVKVSVILMILFYSGPLVTFLLVLVHHSSIIQNKLSLNRVNVDNNSRKNATELSMSLIGHFLSLWYHSLKSQIKMAFLMPELTFRTLCFAPVSEELIFRACIILIMLCIHSNTSTEQASISWNIALKCPLWFGIAHIHHAYTAWTERTKDYPMKMIPSNMKKILFPIVIQTLFQLGYTTIFGFMAALLYMRTGNILAPITSPLENKLDDVDVYDILLDYTCLYRYRWFLLLLHFFGLLSFTFLLFPLTETLSQNSKLWI